MNLSRYLEGSGPLNWRASITVLCMLVLLCGCSPMLRWQTIHRDQSTSPQMSLHTNYRLHRLFVTVQRGETLYSIAFRHDLDFHQVAVWNQIGPGYKIYPGERIRLTPPPENIARKRRVHLRSPSNIPASRADSTQQNGLIPLDSVPPQGFPKFNIHDWQWPVRGQIVQHFDPGNGDKGIDIAANLGQPVMAAAPGKVVYSGNALKGYGQLIIVKHNARYLSAYAYNDTILVRQGQWVRAGQVIATVGEGPKHRAELHFEIRELGKPVNPLRFLPESARR